MKIKKLFAKLIKLIFAAVCAVLIYALVVNFAVMIYGNAYIVKPDELNEKYDCIIVLGCQVNGNSPSDMLKDRLDRAVELYDEGISDTVLMSGDGRSSYYDEISVMKSYAVEKGVPEECILTDSYGLSTYETMFRAAEEFGVEKPLIVTQKFHLFRSVFNARRLGMEAYGIVSMPNTYISQTRLSAREILARNKDFIFSFIKPHPDDLKEYQQ